MGNNIVTLTLTVPALEKLFEGDPDFVLQLRKSVLTYFVKSKIGHVLDAAMKAEIDREVQLQVGTVKLDYPAKITIAPALLAQIKQEAALAIAGVRPELENFIVESVRDRLEATKETVRLLVEKRVDAEIRTLVESRVAARMKAVVNAAGI